MSGLVSKLLENCTYSADMDGSPYRASFETTPIKGENVLVFKGKAYSSGEICEKSVVVKALKYISGISQDFEVFKLCNDTGRKMAMEFNNLLANYSVKILFVQSIVTEINERATFTKFFHKQFVKNEAVLFEEKLKGAFSTFVGKRGECSSNGDHPILEAFCHFSYIVSRKDLVICGLKGIRSRGKSVYTLTNPTIHSRTGQYGPKDKRDAGIRDVLENHRCNKYCYSIQSKLRFEQDENREFMCP